MILSQCGCDFVGRKIPISSRFMEKGNQNGRLPRFVNLREINIVAYGFIIIKGQATNDEGPEMGNHQGDRPR